VNPFESLTEKKPYETPRLTIHGEIREITQNINKKGRKDSGANKT
jgi:hypothetical protein